ncbi:hypothetical protein IP84_12315 [beta proteobacterium AAP99]|nr:hypothetical protein IP84_12315 [beta proteobacterium AAP99]
MNASPEDRRGRTKHLALASSKGASVESIAAAAPLPHIGSAAGQIALHAGYLGAREDGSLQVVHNGAVLPVQLASSCLLQAQAADLVAYVLVGETGYVVHVLKAAASNEMPPRVQLPPDAQLAVGAGTLTLSAPEIALQTPALKVDTERTEFRAREAQVVAERAFSVVGALDAVWTSVKMAGTLWRSVFDRHESHAQHHLRVSEGTDAVKAPIVDVQADTLASTRAENVAIDAKTLVKLRGGQVHIG